MKIFGKTDNTKFLATIYQDIYAIEIESKDSFDDLFASFIKLWKNTAFAKAIGLKMGMGEL